MKKLLPVAELGMSIDRRLDNTGISKITLESAGC